MKRLVFSLLLSIAAALPASAQEYYDVDVDLPAYPEMEPIPDSPVYYAPAVDANYFYYDGLYWDFYSDGWYSSPWYNGPWTFVDPVYVPTYVLWIPVGYYRRPPAYFRGWHPHRPPRWGQHWGADWQRRHNEVYRGRAANVGRAPLPQYQRQYTRENYPRGLPQQAAIHRQQFGYQPRESVGRQQYQSRGIAPNPAQRAVPAQPQPQQGRGQEQRQEHGEHGQRR